MKVVKAVQRSGQLISHPAMYLSYLMKGLVAPALASTLGFKWQPGELGNQLLRLDAKSLVMTPYISPLFFY